MKRSFRCKKTDKYREYMRLLISVRRLGGIWKVRHQKKTGNKSPGLKVGWKISDQKGSKRNNRRDSTVAQLVAYQTPMIEVVGLIPPLLFFARELTTFCPTTLRLKTNHFFLWSPLRKTNYFAEFFLRSPLWKTNCVADLFIWYPLRKTDCVADLFIRSTLWRSNGPLECGTESLRKRDN